MSGVLGGSEEGGRFLISEVPLYGLRHAKPHQKLSLFRVASQFFCAVIACMLNSESARQWMQQSLRESDRALQQVARAADR